MNDDHELTADTQRPREGRGGPGRTSRRAVVTFLGVAAIALTALVAVTTIRDNDREPAATSAHTGMVTGTVWVANEDGNSLSAIDAATNKVVTTVEGIEGPHNVQVAPDGRSVWAVSGHDSLAVMLDATTMDLHGAVATGEMPAHVVVAPDGSTAYTTNGADGTVTAIDTATMLPKASIPVGDGPHGLRPSPDGRWVVVANMAGSTLSVIDTAADRRAADIEVGDAPAQVAFSPDGRFVYTSLNAENAVAKVDLQKRSLVGKLDVGPGPIQTHVSPDGSVLLVANQGTDDDPGTTISVVDTDTFTVRATIDTGRGAHGIVIEPAGRHAYITNIYGNDVAVVDLRAMAVVARIPVGAAPNGISFSPAVVRARPAVELRLPDPTESDLGGHAGMAMDRVRHQADEVTY